MMTISDQLYQRASVRKVPLGGTIELSPVCNFACKMCYVRKTPQQLRCEGKELIDFHAWLDLAKQWKQAGTLYLLLTGGEPFLYPNFRELYESLHDMGFLLSINTNASMIDESVLAWLLKRAPSRMNITLYGASRETYARICGNPDGYDRAAWAIRQLKEAGVPLVINASMIPENADDLEKIILFGKALDIHTRMSTYMLPPVRRAAEETDSRFTPRQSAQMFMRQSRCSMSEDMMEDMFRRKKTESFEDWGKRPDEMICRAGRSTFFVSWEGKMSACGLCSFPLENDPFRRPFIDCWNELTETVRAARVLEKCRDCALRHICNPCAATVLAECGDVNGKPEYLCRLAQYTKEEIDTYLKEKHYED